MARFNWKEFMNNREAQAAAAALAATGVSRLAGLGWAPSLGLGALAGGTWWGGRTLWDRYKDGDNIIAEGTAAKAPLGQQTNKKLQQAADVNRRRSVVAPTRIALHNQIWNPQLTNSVPNANNGSREAKSPDPQATENYRKQLAAVEAAIAKARSEYDQREHLRQKDITDREANIRANVDRRKRERQRLQESNAVDAQYPEPYHDPDGSLEEDYERMNNETAHQEMIERSELRRADVRRRAALAEQLRRYEEASRKEDWRKYGEDPYTMSNSEAFAQTTGRPFILAANKAKQAVNAVKDIAKGTGSQANADRNAVLGGITSALVRAKTDRNAAGDILFKLQDKIKSMPLDVQKKYYNAVKQVLFYR